MTVQDVNRGLMRFVCRVEAGITGHVFVFAKLLVEFFYERRLVFVLICDSQCAALAQGQFHGLPAYFKLFDPVDSKYRLLDID